MHVAPQGRTLKRIEGVASKANACRKLSFAVAWKSAQDRYEKLQERADEAVMREAFMSGIDGEVGETEELLSAMCKTKIDIMQTREGNRRDVSEREEEQEKLEAIVRERAMKRQQSSIRQYSVEQKDLRLLHKRAPRVSRFTDDDKLLAFAAVLKEGNTERAKLKWEKLEPVKMQFEDSMKDRESQKNERSGERKDAHKLELESPSVILHTMWKPE